MNLTIKGEVYRIYDTAQITEKMRKREFVVRVASERNDGEFDYVKCEMINARCEMLDSIYEGDKVEVTMQLKGRLYSKEGKEMFFTTLQAWMVRVLSSGKTYTPNSSKPQTTADKQPTYAENKQPTKAEVSKAMQELIDKAKELKAANPELITDDLPF